MKRAIGSENRAEVIGKLEKLITKIDPLFTSAIKKSEPCSFGIAKTDLTHFQSLVRSVIAQQVSKPAATTIGERLRNLCGGRITAENVRKLSLLQLQSVGLTGAKVRTLAELTDAVLEGKINFRKLVHQSDQEIIKALSSLFGFGKWTAEMFLMFQLGRLDVWPVDDLAVRRGWDNLHPGSSCVTPKTLQMLGEPFFGMRSIVAWYCWRAS